MSDKRQANGNRLNFKPVCFTEFLREKNNSTLLVTNMKDIWVNVQSIFVKGDPHLLASQCEQRQRWTGELSNRHSSVRWVIQFAEMSRAFYIFFVFVCFFNTFISEWLSMLLTGMSLSELLRQSISGSICTKKVPDIHPSLTCNDRNTEIHDCCSWNWVFISYSRLHIGGVFLLGHAIYFDSIPSQCERGGWLSIMGSKTNWHQWLH